MIEQIDANTFTTSARGNTMTLIRATDGWDVLTRNASAIAWNRGPSFKHFESLADVEAKYKSWRGITQLVADHSQTAIQ